MSWLALGILASASSAKLKGYSTPVNLSGPGASGPEIAVDPQGRATVVWQKGHQIRAMRLNVAGKPGPVRTLSGRAAKSRAPKVAVDPNGRATVVWRRVDGVNDSIEAVRIGAAGKPGPVRRVSGPDEGPPIVYRIAPQVAVDPQGRATVVWVRERLGISIEAVRIGAGGKPGPFQTLFEAVDLGGSPQVAVDPNGRATVVWRTSGPTVSDPAGSIQAVRLDAAGEPGPITILDEADDGVVEPRVAVDPAGRATIVWRRPARLGAAGGIQVVRLDAAAGNPGPVHTLAETSRVPDVAVDPEGRATVVWRGWHGGSWRVQAVRLDAAGNPGPVQTLSEAAKNGSPQVAVDPNGRATVVWRERGRVRGVRLDAAGAPGPVQTLASVAFNPKVAVAPNGRATVAWRQFDGDRSYRVQAARSVRLFAVRAKPGRRTVGPRAKRVRYRFHATSKDTEPSGVVRLCAKAPARRVKVLGKRCRVFEDVEPGARVRRVVRVRPLGRARGRLTGIRLHARGPNVEAGTRALLEVRR